MPFRNILVPTDFSEPALEALRTAVALARHRGASITLLHVGTMPHYVATDLDFAGPAVSTLLSLTETISAQQRHLLERLVHEEVPESVTTTVDVRQGSAAEVILEVASTGGHDLVVMGTVGRTGVQRVLMGSVAERVIRQAQVPVLVTHARRAGESTPPG